jgi:hypothetical protein
MSRFPRRSPTPVAVSVTGACALLAGLVLSGCGGSSPSSASTPAATGSALSTGSASSAAAPAPTTAASTHAAAAGSNPICPTAAAVSAAAGSTYPAPQSQSAAGTLICSYENDSLNLVISLSPAAGITASVLKSTILSEAQAQHVPIAPISGIGSAAYLFTQNDAATTSTHVATNTIGVLTGSRYILLTGEMTAAQVEAVARLAANQ